MLDELRIRDLGVIGDATLPLGPGLTVVTGETGAGKTMVVAGLLLLFGGRADVRGVRAGAGQACVDGRITLPAGSPVADRVRDAGGALDVLDAGNQRDDAQARPPVEELVLRRVVHASGRSRAYVGGAPAPAALCAELADALLAVHGQADQVRLARPAFQRTALDRYAGVELEPYRRAYSAWRAAARELADRTARAAEMRRESDLLTHGLAEIARLAPCAGEEVELAGLAARLRGAEFRGAAARTAHDALAGAVDDIAGESADVSQLLARALRALAVDRDVDPDLRALVDRLEDLAAAAGELAGDFGRYADLSQADPARLDQVEARRAELASLVRKYCDEPEPCVAAVLRWADAARARLADIDVSDEALTGLRARRDEAAGQAADLADKISAQRGEAAIALADSVTAELAGLAMPSARLLVEVVPRADPALPTLVVRGEQRPATADGVDEVRVLLQPHPDAPPLPLARGASGGELSRVMLALEVCLVDADPVPILVFDEVDAGVGGRAAVEVGRRLAHLARERQVLVVTHLPQVAAFADRHVVVDKSASSSPSGAVGTVTASDVRVVIGADRVGELARMLAGSDTALAREHAGELLDAATRQREIGS